MPDAILVDALHDMRYGDCAITCFKHTRVTESWGVLCSKAGLLRMLLDFL
jgi:hypothetical protein